MITKENFKNLIQTIPADKLLEVLSEGKGNRGFAFRRKR